MISRSNFAKQLQEHNFRKLFQEASHPTEQVWRQLREDFLSNRCFEDEKDIVNACCEAWNSFDDKPGAVKSLCSRGWANLIG